MNKDNETAHKLFEIYGKLKNIRNSYIACGKLRIPDLGEIYEERRQHENGLTNVMLEIHALAYDLLPEKTPKDD